MIFKILGIPVTVYILEHGSVPHMMAVNHMNPFVMDVMIGFQENRARLALVSIDITVQKPLIVLLVLDDGVIYIRIFNFEPSDHGRVGLHQGKQALRSLIALPLCLDSLLCGNRRFLPYFLELILCGFFFEVIRGRSGAACHADHNQNKGRYLSQSVHYYTPCTA